VLTFRALPGMNYIIYRANHEATYNVFIKLYISISTTAITELDVKQVKSGLESIEFEVHPNTILFGSEQINDLRAAKYLWPFLCLST
jgi:hypothetical protein